MNLEKDYVETFYVGRQVSFRKDSLQLRRQIPPSLRAAFFIPAGALLFPSRLPSFLLLPTAHQMLLPKVCININRLETRSLHFAHSALQISRELSSKLYHFVLNFEKYYVETFYVGRQVSLRMLAARFP